MHVIVVLFDNTDPAVYGPYEGEKAARDGCILVRDALYQAGVKDHHLEAIVVRPLRRAP